jgi:antitoxin HicB
MIYHAVFERADDGSVWAYVPDLPGCTSWGATMDEARDQIREAITLWLAAVREQGVEPPPPATITSNPVEVDAA